MWLNLHDGLFGVSESTVKLSPKRHCAKFRKSVWIHSRYSNPCTITAANLLKKYYLITLLSSALNISALWLLWLFHCPNHHVKQSNCSRPRFNPLIQGERVGGMSVGWTELWQAKGKRAVEKSHSANQVSCRKTHALHLNEGANVSFKGTSM